MWTRLACQVTACVVLGGFAHAQQPLSAIDWLSDSVAQPAVRPAPPEDAEGPLLPDPQPMDEISVKPIEGPTLDAVGLLPSDKTGLPIDTWGNANSRDIATLIRAIRVSELPAANRFFYTLLLAELAPPAGDATDGTVLLARLDSLLELGALEQAQALVERAGPTEPDLFRRWFDISLLTGHEDRACAAMRAAPGIAPTFPARIFCLARGGDWNAALLTLETAKALGFVTEEEDALLIRFLDPELFEGEPPLPAPSRPSPLVFRMFEAIGEPLPTGSLPLAFAHADLRHTSGWKARIEAAERLARTWAIDPNRLLGIYTERAPAASGGIWDRVAALQAFDAAILGGDVATIAQTLPPAWAAMRAAHLEVPFAELYADKLARLPLTDNTAALAFRIGLLSSGYEAIADRHAAANPRETFLIAMAKGLPVAQPPQAPRDIAVADAFAGAAPSSAHLALLDQGRLGEALLGALRQLETGGNGDLDDMTHALALFRVVGLEDLARRVALQFLILERHG